MVWLAVSGAHARTSAGAVQSVAPVLEEIVVTADRKDSFSADLVQVGSFRGSRQLDTPLTINVIPDAFIQSQQAQGLLDALRITAGVSPAQITTTVYSNLAIRGIEVENRSNYRLNGVLPIVNLVDLPLEDKDRVEVLKGASALYYGFTTPAGIVNMTMKRPTPEPYAAVALFGNQHGAFIGHADFSDTWHSFGARVDAVYGRVDSGIDYTRGRRSLLSGAFDFKPIDEVTISLDAENIEKEVIEPGVFRYLKLPPPTISDLYPALELPPLLKPSTNFGPNWAENHAEERNILVAANWRISRTWALSGSYGSSDIRRDRRLNTIDLDEYGPNTNGDGNLSIGLQPGADFENTNYRLELAGALKTGPVTHELLVGATRNVRDAFFSASIPALCPGESDAAPPTTCRQNVYSPVDIPETPFPSRSGRRTQIDDFGIYLFDRMQATARLKLLAGVRLTDYEEKDVDTGVVAFEARPKSISLGAVVQPSTRVTGYLTYIEGLESTPPAPIAAANAGDILPAAESEQWEAGLKVALRPELLFQAAYFDIERGSAFVNGANVYVLDGRARYRGTEVSLTGEAHPDWSIYATAQFLDARQISGAETRVTVDPGTGAVTVVPTVVGRKVENAPKRTFSLSSEYRLNRLLPGFSVNGAAYYVSERAVNAFNQAFIPAYTLVDVGATYTRAFRGQETTIRATGMNVAGKRYFSSTGANFIAQGPPRTWRLSLSVRF